jgi:hypothetical protein|tara:strand:+ start:314 stop:616 length:303 start_codon:yes stop_codon:yes gene_type:complete
MIFKIDSNKANLYTTSKNLEGIMLSECPIRIYESQRKVDVIEGVSRFCFSELPKEDLLDYLDEIEPFLVGDPYVVIDSQRMEYIKIRDLEGNITNFNEYD